MTAYMIFLREGEIVDAEAMAKYQAANRGGPPLPGMKPLVVYGELETVEGESTEGVVVLEFPDKDTARQWYYSPEYQARAKFRQQAAPYRAFIVEGFALPPA